MKKFFVLPIVLISLFLLTSCATVNSVKNTLTPTPKVNFQQKQMSDVIQSKNSSFVGKTVKVTFDDNLSGSGTEGFKQDWTYIDKYNGIYYEFKAYDAGLGETVIFRIDSIEDNAVTVTGSPILKCTILKDLGDKP